MSKKNPISFEDVVRLVKSRNVKFKLFPEYEVDVYLVQITVEIYGMWKLDHVNVDSFPTIEFVHDSNLDNYHNISSLNELERVLDHLIRTYNHPAK